MVGADYHADLKAIVSAISGPNSSVIITQVVSSAIVALVSIMGALVAAKRAADHAAASENNRIEKAVEAALRAERATIKRYLEAALAPQPQSLSIPSERVKKLGQLLSLYKTIGLGIGHVKPERAQAIVSLYGTLEALSPSNNVASLPRSDVEAALDELNAIDGTS